MLRTGNRPLNSSFEEELKDKRNQGKQVVPFFSAHYFEQMLLLDSQLLGCFGGSSQGFGYPERQL